MNELEFLRSQLRLEQTHLDGSRELLNRALRHQPVDAPTVTARRAALAHLAFGLQRAIERGHVHARQVPERLAQGDYSAAERIAALDAVATLQAVLTPAAVTVVGLSTAVASAADSDDRLRDAAREALPLAEQLGKAAATLEPWCARLYDLSDWRRAARIDAEAVFEERRLHEQAIEHARAAGLLG